MIFCFICFQWAPSQEHSRKQFGHLFVIKCILVDLCFALIPNCYPQSEATGIIWLVMKQFKTNSTSPSFSS